MWKKQLRQSPQSDEKRDTVISANIIIKNVSGLHLRPTGILCSEAMKFHSSIKIQFFDSSINAKSVLSVLGACIKCGDEICFICEGSDEEEALQAMLTLVENGLGE